MIRTWIISFLTLSIVIIAFFSSCEKLPSPGDSPPDEITESDYSIQINSQNRMQEITQWGHDIKKPGTATNLTEAASRQIFQNGRFNLLRVPIYALAHNADGSIRKNYMISMVSEDNQDEETLWEKVPAGDGWFYLRNKAHDKYIKGWNDDDYNIEMASTSNQGTWTQWKLVDAGNGWYHIESKGHQKYIRGARLYNIHLTDTTLQGEWTQWKLVDAGNGYYYIQNKGRNKYKYLRGGGNTYKPIIDAINRAKNNGDPDIYASHKIYDFDDFSTWHNSSFGPFYTKDGIDASGFAAAIDAFMDYIYNQTGKTVKYLAPRCELGNHWTTDKFVQVVNNLTAPPPIVYPETAGPVNGEKYWTDEAAQVTDVKATHYKGGGDWPVNAKYDWNSETNGKRKDGFIFSLFKALNQSFYIGKVKSVVLWEDSHLNSTDDKNNRGPFRRELVEASAHNLVECDPASYADGAAALAFETAQDNQIKVFYSSVGTVEFTFDRVLEPGSVPSDASVTGPKSFIVNSTGKIDYRSFTLSFRGNQ